jgi:molybdate/tungstate transport system substrate-binding protein
MRGIVRGVCLAAALLVMIPAAGCSAEEKEKTEMLVLTAGSLVIPMEELEAGFEALHPEVDLRFEGHGSIQVIRHITEIGDPADVGIVADYSLLPLFMYLKEMPDGGIYTDWNIQFATNQFGIAYSPDSIYADEITAENRYEILRRPDVHFGFSDPRIDSLGYRTLMVLQLAEDYYGDEYIFDDIITDNFRSTVTSTELDGNYSIRVPELLESTNDRIYLRGFSVQLLALLESHQIDYAFQYESVARQHGLEFLDLPVELDMSSQEMADYYRKVTVYLDFQRFKSVEPVFTGEPILYGVTIPASAPNPELAEEFIRYLLGEEGRRILSENYQPLIIPPTTDNIDSVPAGLRDLLEE